MTTNDVQDELLRDEGNIGLVHLHRRRECQHVTATIVDDEGAPGQQQQQERDIKLHGDSQTSLVHPSSHGAVHSWSS